MSETFSGCKNLEELDISTFNTASVEKMNCTFRFCQNLKVLDLRNFDTSKVTFTFDTFGYCKNLVYINVSSFNTKNIQVMRGLFITCEKLKYLDISNFDFSGVINYDCANDDTEGKNCRFHYSFANNFQLKCLNFINFYIDNKLYDNTFDQITSSLPNIKFCVNEDNIKVNDLKNSIKNNCNDQCFKDMSKKFDISQNEYVDSCATQKFDFNDLCWEDCPYNYYKIFTDRRTCLKEKPGENYYLGDDNIYFKCYKSCKTCTIQGNDINHNCDQCAEDYKYMSTAEDKYAIANSCYKNCDKYYYFNSNHEYFCVEECPSGFKLISQKKKCIDLCTNDDTYKNEYGNTCVKDCPIGTVNIDNICKPCYDSCNSCSAEGSSTTHNCDECKTGFSKLNKDNNCYEDCANYYYFKDSGEYVCLTEDKCPDGYKLIDETNKCIKNCKNDNIFDSKYEYNGKCYKSCSKGSYTEGGIDYCYCESNITCKDCSLSAIEQNLCSSCNNRDGYYPKQAESSDTFKNCYNSASIPKNYILNLTKSRYEPCYETCGSCDAIGSSTNHKCKDCKEGFSKLNNDNNCYEDCDHYYYFNEQKNYVCLDHDECPQDYKLINTKKKCITNCKDDNIFNYIYEYNGGCYENCEKGFYTNEVNINICKCMTNSTCKDCTSSAIEKKLCSTCNEEGGYYPKKEESSNTFKNCYNSASIPKNYILISKQYEPCYESCGACDAIGTSTDHKCKDCKEGYSDLNKDSNCYKICSHYYYFNEAGGYVCLEQNECPEGYKLIDGTNKCIKNCKDDNIFDSKFEFNGKCYKNCPNGHYSEGDKDICKCMANIACKDCPSKNNVNNLCSTCNVDGHYYPIKDESSNELKNCYNSETIPENYIFKEDISQYEACYISCQTCEAIGDSSDHKCLTCKNGYKKNSDLNNNNCEQACTYYFYYDENNAFKCTDEAKCPTNYKLVHSTTKCIPNCNSENLYEYNDVCYEICNNGFYVKDGIETCKCMTNIKCQECPLSGNENNLCSGCNIEGGYYPKAEESTLTLKNCYDSTTIPKNYFFNDNSQYELCYESCGSCGEKGDESVHKCIKCKDDTYAKLNNDNNCYKICANYYYFKNSGEYVCLEQNECPEGYKLIDGTNKCIENCKDDNIFNSKFEFNGKCYKNCPNDYYTEGDKDICKCMDNIACKDCPSENNANNLCSTCNIEKQYYPKEEGIEETLKNCYNRTTIPTNYILNSGIYKKCYDSCQTCDLIGSLTNHNCKDCKAGYIKLKENSNNCYKICSHYYYFKNSGEYVCLEQNECPESYKLIDGTNKCIKNCNEVDKYEYNGICYSVCPQYWADTNGNHICKLDCPSHDLFFNYERTTCISDIPKGYYIENIDMKTIGKCHENCEECESGPTENNNNCKTCPSVKTIYYDFGNCRETCVNGNYIDENSVKKCKCSNNIECKACDENAKCLSCNNEVGYYQLEENNDQNNEIIKCVKDPQGYYLSGEVYKKCYEKCKSCNGQGENKCTECIDNYEFRNDFENDKKCYEKCPFNYYYDSNNNNKCTSDDSCPSGMKLIESKKRCIDLCKNDNLFRFEFNGKCFAQCPEKTVASSLDNLICEELIENTMSTIVKEEEEEKEEEDKCNLNLNEFNLLNDTLTLDALNNFTTNYASKYGKSGNYITKLENEYFKIFIYNNIICLQNVSQDAKWIDFGESFLSQLERNHLSDPIVTIITNKTSNESTYAFAHPDTGELLNNLNDALRNTEIKVQEDIYSLLSYLSKKQRDYIIHMLKQGIDVLDPSNDFYTNLCFYYDSPNDKDIPMRDRADFFYANINRCETGCTYQGIDFSTYKFKCECKFKGFSDDNTDDSTTSQTKSNNEYPKKKGSGNLEVFKCIKYVFKNKYFKKSAGGIIMLILSAIQIACTILYFVIETSRLRKHTFALLETFKKISSTNLKYDSNPPKKVISNNKKNNNKDKLSSKLKLNKDIILSNSINNKKSENDAINKKKEKKSKFGIKDLNEKEENKFNTITTEKKFQKMDEIKENETIQIENEDMYRKMIKGYINPEFDENDFDDVLAKDKRSFLQFFLEKSFKNQIFVKTFYLKHIFKPLPLKIMLLVLIIELYFTISAFFYTQDYLSERFYSDDKESFLSFVPKRLYEIIFTMIICGIIQYFCTYFFDCDDDLRRIFTNKIKISTDLALAKFIKNLKIKFIILIVISIIITIFSFLYISSFNVVYPYIKREWIKCSVLILILMQIVNLISTLLGTCCRYLSIKWNSIKLFRLSLNLD